VIYLRGIRGVEVRLGLWTLPSMPQHAFSVLVRARRVVRDGAGTTLRVGVVPTRRRMIFVTIVMKIRRVFQGILSRLEEPPVRARRRGRGCALAAVVRCGAGTVGLVGIRSSKFCMEPVGCHAELPPARVVTLVLAYGPYESHHEDREVSRGFTPVGDLVRGCMLLRASRGRARSLQICSGAGTKYG
jgi:hypothetical protein